MFESSQKWQLHNPRMLNCSQLTGLSRSKVSQQWNLKQTGWVSKLLPLWNKISHTLYYHLAIIGHKARNKDRRRVHYCKWGRRVGEWVFHTYYYSILPTSYAFGWFVRSCRFKIMERYLRQGDIWFQTDSYISVSWVVSSQNNNLTSRGTKINALLNCLARTGRISPTIKVVCTGWGNINTIYTN